MSFPKLPLGQNPKDFEFTLGAVRTGMPENVAVSPVSKKPEHAPRALQKTPKETTKEPRTFGLSQVYPDPLNTTETTGKAVE